MIRDERRLRRRLDRARRHRDPGKRERALAALDTDITDAEQRVARRRASVPTPAYPAELPVTAARDELLAAIGDAQVVVVSGETGSGKTTQLPKLCLELGRGVLGRIGHTQPRRLAARSVADRVAEELGTKLGHQIGYQVRFSDRTSEDTLVKVMTDGILLAEVQRDPALRAYDTIILDEAHERSLNIDFLLGYLKQLLPRRPDLKVIITSATIDVERLSQHFDDAPIVEVSGRTYPVEVRYRPLDEGQEQDQIEGVSAAIDELAAEGPGDILVFLPGERDIRDTAEALGAQDRRDTEILPLFARLSAAEQHRVFAPHAGRRVVLATNVAETSLTVPGIRYVVDVGTARVSRYSHRTKVQRLPIEKISRASAEQRKGRCGRVADGICIRLYSKEDFEARPEFTDPEILRTNLASVILQMIALGLGDVAEFPFVDPPDRRSVRDAEALLGELGAITPEGTGGSNGQHQLTAVGRTLTRLPVDPRLGRMIIEGHRNGCLAEVLVITSALSIQDPRERPADAQGHADELHGRFADEHSDFASYLHLWSYLDEQQRALSSNAFRRQCKAEYLHYLRVREWWDLHAQLCDVAEDEGMRPGTMNAERDQVAQSLLAGLLSQIGMRPSDGREYQGARGTRFVLWPGSALARRPPVWVMVAELVETSRLWGRTAGTIEPQWAERLAGELVSRTYSEPRWDRQRGAAVADERVTLYGVPLVPARTVVYHRVDPAVSRELFIRHALVEGDWDTHHTFLAANQRLIDEVADLEARARRRDLVVDDEALADFYRARVPASAVTARHFDRWWKTVDEPDLLTLDREFLLAGAAETVRPEDFPDVWRQDGLELALSYRFDPGADDDGVTVDVPLAGLHHLSSDGFDWHVPGRRAELVEELVRGLPKQLRRQLVPIPDTVARVLPSLDPRRGRLVTVLAEEVRRHTGVVVPADAWPTDALPDHLRVTFRVVDGQHTVAQGKDLAALQRQLAGRARAAVASAGADLETHGHRQWPVSRLPRSVQAQRDGAVVLGYPALVDEGSTVGVRVLLSEQEQQRAMWQGNRRLLLTTLPPPVKTVAASLSRESKLTLTRNPHGSVAALLNDATAAAVDGLMADHGGPAWDEESFAKLRAAVGQALDEAVLEVVSVVEQVLVATAEAQRRLDGTSTAALRPTRDDARAHLARLVHDGFISAAGRHRLPDVARYARGIALRLEKAVTNPERDRALLERVADVQQAYVGALRRLGPRADAAAYEVGWMIEELRVSLFAQQLGTAYRVSEQRVLRAIAELEERS